MSEARTHSPRVERVLLIGSGLTRICEGLALLGGAVLMLVMMVTVVSVIGGAVFNRPLLGDSEVVEIGIAFAVFSYLAWCQIRGANVIVDFFTRPLPARVRDLIDTFCDLVFALVVLVLTWRLAIGGMETFHRGDVSTFLQIPTWWGYLGAFVSCLLWAAACLYTAVAAVLGVSPRQQGERL